MITCCYMYMTWCDKHTFCWQTRLIVSCMSDTTCEVFNWLLLPLIVLVVGVQTLTLGITELYLLWAYTLFVIAAHIHYGICVVCNTVMCKASRDSFSQPVLRQLWYPTWSLCFLYVTSHFFHLEKLCSSVSFYYFQRTLHHTNIILQNQNIWEKATTCFGCVVGLTAVTRSALNFAI